MSHRLRLTCLLAALFGLAGCNPGVSVPGTVPPPPAPSVPPVTPPPATLAVFAAGNAANPPSLTAVTQDQRVVIDAVQPLHPAASPSFQGLRLSQPGQQAADALLGWQRASGELVLVQAPLPPASSGPVGNSGRSTVRVVRAARELSIRDGDQVLVVQVNGSLDLPDVVQTRVPEGRLLTVKAGVGVNALEVSNMDLGTVALRSGQSVQLIAVGGTPAWLVLGRN